jgi:mRNA interferase HigB
LSDTKNLSTFLKFLFLLFVIVGVAHPMHIISRKALRNFWETYPDSQNALVRWYKIATRENFDTFQSLRKHFPTADIVGNFIVFNIGGNKYRLIASIHFNRQKIYIRYVLTHSEYDQGGWKK